MGAPGPSVRTWDGFKQMHRNKDFKSPALQPGFLLPSTNMGAPGPEFGTWDGSAGRCIRNKDFKGPALLPGFLLSSTNMGAPGPSVRTWDSFKPMHPNNDFKTPALQPGLPFLSPPWVLGCPRSLRWDLG